jgi:hypothetical protein
MKLRSERVRCYVKWECEACPGISANKTLNLFQTTKTKVTATTRRNMNEQNNTEVSNAATGSNWCKQNQYFQTTKAGSLLWCVKNIKHHCNIWGFHSGPASCLFLAWLTLHSRRPRKNVPLKRRLTFNGLHAVISQKAKLSLKTLCIRGIHEPYSLNYHSRSLYSSAKDQFSSLMHLYARNRHS